MRWWTLIAVVVFAMGLLFSAQMSHAAFCTRSVDRTDDEPSATACTALPNDRSLRGALSGAVSGSFICVPAATYFISGTELSASVNLTMRGAGATSTFVRPATGQNIRVLSVQSGVTVTVEDMTLKLGAVNNEKGGCITNEGNLNLSGVNVEQCQASGGYAGGGIYSAGGTNLTLSNCWISYDQAYTIRGRIKTFPEYQKG